MLTKFLNPSSLAIVAATSVQFALFLRWLYRRIRADEINRVFVEDMATNHLPHLYRGVQKIAGAMEIDLGETPPIRWIDLSRKS